MNKLLSIILCLLVLCMALCACGRGDTVSQMASDALSDIETAASEMLSPDNGTVEDGDGKIGNETYASTENTDNTGAFIEDNTETMNDNANSNTNTEPYM